MKKTHNKKYTLVFTRKTLIMMMWIIRNGGLFLTNHWTQTSHDLFSKVFFYFLLSKISINNLFIKDSLTLYRLPSFSLRQILFFQGSFQWEEYYGCSFWESYDLYCYSLILTFFHSYRWYLLMSCAHVIFLNYSIHSFVVYYLHICSIIFVYGSEIRGE